MKKVILRNKAVRKMVKAVAIAGTASIGIIVINQLFSWADRQDQREHLKQKECWKEIYSIIEKSPKEKVDWIKQTIEDRISFLGGVNYCNALELIKNGQDHDKSETKSNKSNSRPFNRSKILKRRRHERE